MHGNACEWCNDWFGVAYYQMTPVNDPPGPEDGVERVYRGGSWSNPFHVLRAADRHMGVPSQATCAIGFRVVRGP